MQVPDTKYTHTSAFWSLYPILCACSQIHSPSLDHLAPLYTLGLLLLCKERKILEVEVWQRVLCFVAGLYVVTAHTLSELW